MIRILFLLLIAIFVVACSDEQPQVDEHVWKEQADMIDKAHDVEQLINATGVQQRQLIEQQTQ